MSIETCIGYTFKNRALLQEALTHPSCAKTKNGSPLNYQRLEFLGDSILGAIVADILYRLYPAEPEGNLAKRHAALVRSESLAAIATEIGIAEHIVMTESEEETGGRLNRSTLEDVCEALIGAIYLDGGFEPAAAFIKHHWQPLARATPTPPKDAKTTLQEWAQAHGQPLPHYQVIETSGPAHAPEFTIEVKLEGGQSATGKALAKRQAEQLAAKALLEIL